MKEGKAYLQYIKQDREQKEREREREREREIAPPLKELE